MMLEGSDLSVTRSGRTLLHAISFAAHAGEVVGLIGPNGAGKTTLLRAVCGLDPLTSGEVRFGGRSAAELGRAVLGRTVSYLAQNGRIHWPMRVDQLVALGRLPHGAAATPDDPAVVRAMTAAHVLSLAGRTAGSLSGGERARVLLARALAVEAPLLLADEPVAALDPYHQLQVMELLRTSARAGTGIVVVLHDLTLAARFCDRLLLLREGRLIAQGPPAGVLSPELVGAAYGVTVETGTRQGESFILPWRRLDAPPGQ